MAALINPGKRRQESSTAVRLPRLVGIEVEVPVHTSLAHRAGYTFECAPTAEQYREWASEHRVPPPSR